VSFSSDDPSWTTILNQHPEAHLLQTAAWGELKCAYGWSLEHVFSADAGAQVLFRSLPLGLRLAYVPKGPFGAWLPDLLPQLEEACRAHGALALTVEPDEAEPSEVGAHLSSLGFRPCPRPIQPRRTLLVDLQGSEDDVLGRMSQKTRYNIRLAVKKDVLVRPSSDLEAFGRMTQATGERDAFGVHDPGYYRRAYELFHPIDACELLAAYHQDQLLASLMVFSHGSTAIYLYGASFDLERQRMPTYLLQWEAMRWARARGCTTYDLWGVPDTEQAVLERDFPKRQDGLWGVYRFKRGFGGRLVRSVGAWDRVYKPVAYRAYLLAARWRGLSS
jgi:peptidoglycan pentaglycine glycine transferase (the first glycine)